ncbi:alpha-D-ribose 1-methylphosphonate 5-triphosphate diphosphatase [Mesorhizobium sp. L48C026A00]|uniref:alpha-D-ribose 1-methylphosphonate 5-triphosphate diphosphatase n=1 Tax=Mesorhizobium sp. L48C026A00 TaxID=1287182 RepID=UPI0003CFCAD5|nr:alpha-D-ribose 1-methylphosphonate 5-triphosphate diphosphatase [Mesorhizobium sp. L48C026A00]ESZ05473.1 phosphonate metabolism protein PhnM [Mesorhizobium sp. L48C026A00]
MTHEVSFTNANVVLPNEIVSGGVCLKEGMISDISAGSVSAPSTIDLQGDYLLPGIVDLHTDNLEKHVSPRPGVRWDVKLALMAHDALVVAGGVTTVFDALCVGSTIRKPERNKYLEPNIAGIKSAKERQLLRADHFLHLRCEITDKGVLPLFSQFVDDPLVKLISIMDHAPGHRQAADLKKFREDQYADYGLSSENLEQQIDEWRAASEELGPKHRTHIAESASARSIACASHDDETDAHIEEAIDLGISISEFPTTMTAAKAARKAGLSILMGGPNVVRGGSHSGNIAAGELAREGLLDILASDYIPSSLLQAAFLLTAEHIGLNLPTAVRIISANPAAALGMNDRGAVEVGRRGDLVRVTVSEGTPVVREVWSEGRKVF